MPAAAARSAVLLGEGGRTDSSASVPDMNVLLPSSSSAAVSLAFTVVVVVVVVVIVGLRIVLGRVVGGRMEGLLSLPILLVLG